MAHGPAVTTSQIAVAAEVAEGTIFSVFPDKETLIRAAVTAAFDPEPAVRRLASIDPAAALTERLTAAVEILQDRLSQVFHLVTTFGLHGAPHDHGSTGPPPNAAILEALTGVLAPSADQLRKEPSECARLLRLVVFAGSHPRITDDNPLSATEMVDLLLNGMAKSRSDQTVLPPEPTGE